jgi:Zn ribbon nucleic-acid-binding protein
MHRRVDLFVPLDGAGTKCPHCFSRPEGYVWLEVNNLSYPMLVPCGHAAEGQHLEHLTDAEIVFAALLRDK